MCSIEAYFSNMIDLLKGLAHKSGNTRNLEDRKESRDHGNEIFIDGESGSGPVHAPFLLQGR